MRFTSYEDTGSHAPIEKLDSNTADGLRTCYQKTEEYIRKIDKEAPENTKSNPATRIKQFRESISWGRFADKEVEVLHSQNFKKSAILFIHCVLSSTYGDNITIEAHKVSQLNKEKNFFGRSYFLESLQEALYGSVDEKVGMDMNKDEILFIYNNKKDEKQLIGLMSATGPIPSIDYIANFHGLRVDETEGTKSLIDKLEDQDKEILRHYLDANASYVQDCDLYKDIKKHLGNVVVTDAIRFELKIEKLDGGFSNFPVRETITQDILSDSSITLIPLYGSSARLGYNLPTLQVEVEGLPYAFIPPFTEGTIASMNAGEMDVKTLKIEEEIANDKIMSVKVDCEVVTGKGFKTFASHTYTKEQIWFVKRFPSISIYGPSPKFGWIARRDLNHNQDVGSPLASEYEVMIEGLKDIEFVGLKFDPVEESADTNFSIYCGEIPKWVCVRGNGNYMGAIPLRLNYEDEKTTQVKKNVPLFVRDDVSSNKKMKVAVDIGSSRSVVLFWEDLMNENTIEYTLIENEQLLKVAITSPIDMNKRLDREMLFGDTVFQPDFQYGEVKGKTPLAIIPTPRFNEEDILLYRSGKLLLLDAKNVSSTGGKNIISDIKAHMHKNSEKKQAMRLLIQGILVLIVERAIHLGCSDINIRTAYLTEQYNMMRGIWDNAKKQIQMRMPDVRVKINIDLCLPESLAIANMISKKGFRSGSGAALVDIGDFSTDIALFKNSSSSGSGVELLKNFSIHFAGNKILLNSIWEYLHFSENPDLMEVFGRRADDDKYTYVKTIYDTISASLKGARSELGPTGQIRSNILCLMNRLNKGKIPEKLQNLFDLGYLVEVLILKQLIKEMDEGAGTFNIHLFGGGSSHFRAQEEGFNWSEVLGRPCETYDESQDGNILAQGLLWGIGEEIHENIRSAAKKEKKKAEDYEREIKKHGNINELPLEDLKKGCVELTEAAEMLKTTWHFKDLDGNNVNTRWVFNMQQSSSSSSTDPSSYEPLDSQLWRKYFEIAQDAARDAMTDDPQIFKLIFAYKMIYSCVIEFYTGVRRFDDED